MKHKVAWFEKISYAAVVAAIALLGVTKAYAEAIQRRGGPASIEQILTIPDVENYVTAPNGDVAWVERVGGTWNVHIARHPDYQPTKLTNFAEDDGQRIDIVGFGPRGSVVFVCGRGDKNPSQGPDPIKVTVYEARKGTAKLKTILANVNMGFSAPILSEQGRTLTYARGGAVLSVDLTAQKQRPTRLFTLRGTVPHLVYSPDEKHLAFVSDRSNYERGKYSFVGVFDLATRNITYMAPGLGADVSPIWSPDGTKIAFIRVGLEPREWRFTNHLESAPFSIVMADPRSGAGKEIFVAALGEGSHFWGPTGAGVWGIAGGESLHWTASNELLFPYEKTGWVQIYAVPASGGAVRQVTSGEFEVDTVRLSADRQALYYLANSEDDLARLGLYKQEIAAGSRPTRMKTGDDGDMPVDVRVLPDDALAMLIASPSGPPELVIQKESTKVASLSTAFDRETFGESQPEPKIIEFKSGDGLVIPAILRCPKGAARSSKAPLIVDAHGGSRLQRYPVWEMHIVEHHLRRMLIRGYCVMSVNYRSGTGYGLKYREPESYGGRGAGDVDDFIAAAKYVARELPQIDPNRIGIVGHSYGGHLVTNVLARSNKYKAGVSSAGVGDWVVEMEKDFGEELQMNIPERLKIEELAHQSSAISQIDKWGDEPILFIHGDNDSAAAMQQSLELYMALRRRGKHAEALVIPEETHKYDTLEHQILVMQTMEEFFDRHLGE